MDGFKDFYEVARYLRKNLSLKHPVHIRRVKMPQSANADGDCSFSKKIFTIRIEKCLKCYYAIDVLIHEFGHVLAWDKDKDDHGPNWGKSYSIVYRKFLQWMEENEKAAEEAN